MHSFGINQTRLIVSSSLRCSCSRTDHPPSRCTCSYTWHPPCARCTHHLQLLAGFPPGMLSAPSPCVLAVTCLDIHIVVFSIHLSFHLQVHWLTLLHVHWLTLLEISSKVHSSTDLQLQFSAGKCAPRCFLPALLVRWFLAVGVGFDSGTVIPLLYVIASPTTDPLQLLRVPYRLVRVASEVDFPVAAVYLGIVTWTCGFLIHLEVGLPSLL